MLSRIQVKNFKCLRDVEVELSPLTVLIGPNDSGKTSFLSALQLLEQLACSDGEKGTAALDVANALRQNSWRLNRDVPIELVASATDSLDIDFTLFFKATRDDHRQLLNNKGSLEFSVEYVRNLGGNTVQLKVGKNLGGTFSPDNNIGLLPFTIRAVGDEKLRETMKLIQDLFRVSAAFRFSPTEMRKPCAASDNPILGSRGENLAAVINAILTGPDRELIAVLERSLHQAIPSVRGLSTPAGGNHGAERVIRFTLSGTEKPPLTIPSDEVSDGAMYLTAFLALIHTHPARVFLIEEPENGLHPARLQSIIDLLRKMTTGELGSPPRQIILTTHSPVLLNCVKPEEVRIFRRDEDGATHVKRMDQLPDIDRLMKEFAPGELWYLFGEEELVRGTAS